MDQLPTAAACDIAGIDRQRFNEDVAAGHYPCAPIGKPRVGRWFDEIDTCGLLVYSFLLTVWNNHADSPKRAAVSKRVAAMYACKVMEAMRANADGSTRIDFPLSGFNDNWAMAHDGDAPNFFAPLEGANVQAVGSGIATICFSLDGIRERVRCGQKRWAGEA